MKRTNSFVLTVCAAVCLFTAAQAGFAYSGGLNTAEMKRLSALRRAGLDGDTSQAEALRGIVRNAGPASTRTFSPFRDELLVMTALRSLTRLHAVSAIAEIDALRLRDKQKYPGVSNFAAVEEARLKAEGETGGVTADPRSQVSAFYNALGMTPADITAGIEDYRKQYYASAEGQRLPLPVAVYALREVADMAYRSQSPGVASLIGTSAPDFSKDYPSALKMRLAPLPREARVTALIDSLVSTKVFRADEDFTMRLLADEGSAAGRAIAARLGDALEHRGQYQETNILMLFRVLSAIGDAEQAPAVARFQTDPSVSVRQEAETLSHNLPSGTGSLFPRAAGY